MKILNRYKNLIICFSVLALLFSGIFSVQTYAAEEILEAEETFSIDSFGPTKLSAIIYSMAKKVGMDAIINPTVDGTALISFKDKTITEAMDILGTAYGFGWLIKNNTIVVSPADTMQTQSERFTLKFADPELVKNELKLFIDENKLTVNTDDSSISIDTTKNNIDKAREKIAQIDVAPNQVFIKAQIVELSRTASSEIGFSHSWGDYSNQSLTKTLSYGVTARASEILGKGKLIASPSIMTINGREAIIKMGTRVPVLITTVATDGTKSTTVDYKDVGYFLTTKPRVNNAGIKDEYITVELAPEVSSITGWVSDANGTKAPQISSREAKTNVRVKSGETIIIGGLVKKEELRTLTGIPGLSKIPILGKLFQYSAKSKDDSEVFIFVTPTVMKDLPGETANE
ncbi:MAG: type II and III secretion system protein [Sporomusaceae bacterium]|jgi:type IV pilus assembly protein PilQ|nr:type II and III secretion system protein [Sporomusaceae bacterium]